MFSVTVLRTLRRCVVPQPLGHVTAARRVAALSAACFRGQSLQSAGLQSRGLCERSFLNLNDKVQSRCQSARCVSTATHSDDGNLVYTGSLGTAVRGVKLFSYSTSGVSLLLMPHVLLKTGLVVQSIAMKAAFCGVVGFFTFLTPVVLHLITKGYVARLYHHPDRDTYTAITYSVLLTEKKTVFHQRQVRIPAISQMFTTFYAGNTGLLVNPDMFPVPHDYNHLMGYDQPFSFNTDDMDPPDRSRTTD